MKCDLHLVSWNRSKMTELVIRTIHRNTKPENFRLVVLDNGSDEETVEMLKRLHDNGLIDELKLFPENFGLEQARQWMLENCTDSEYFICVDNDCLPPYPHPDGKDWTEKLVDLMKKNPGYAAISCRTFPMIGSGNIFEEADRLGEEIVEFPHPGGSLRIMRTQAVRDVGGWDRGAEGRGSEETYICGKLREVGWQTGFAVGIPTLHLFGLKDTDFWGYDKTLKPEDTGHSSGVWHPKFAEGDVYEEVVLYCGEELADAYCSVEE